jgi:hypothetical protein
MSLHVLSFRLSLKRISNSLALNLLIFALLRQSYRLSCSLGRRQVAGTRLRPFAADIALDTAS